MRVTTRRGDNTRGYHMLSHPPGRYHTGWGMMRARGDNVGGGTTHGDTTAGGQHRGGMTQARGDDVGGGTMHGDTTEGGRHVVSPVSSPLAHVVPPSVWCLLGGVRQHVVSPVSSPLTHVVPLTRIIPPHPRRSPFSVVSPRRGGTTCGVPVSSPLTRVIPPSVWCLLGGVGQHVVSPMSSPLARVVPPCPRHPPSPASSLLQCGVS